MSGEVLFKLALIEAYGARYVATNVRRAGDDYVCDRRIMVHDHRPVDLYGWRVGGAFPLDSVVTELPTDAPGTTQRAAMDREDARCEGYTQGHAEGFRVGRAQGVREGRRAAARALAKLVTEGEL